MNNEGYPITEYPVLKQQEKQLIVCAPPAQSPEYEQVDDDKRKYYKNLSKSYKEDNNDLYISNVDLLRKNKKLKNENEKLKIENKNRKLILDNLKKTMKEINLSLLQEMDDNAVLESKIVLSDRKYEKIKKLIRKQNKEDMKYCYIPKIFPRKKY